MLFPELRFILLLGSALVLVSPMRCVAQPTQPAPELWKSPISDTLNVRFVENHIIINRPALSVFDWVTTWGNLPKWLPVAGGVEMKQGTLNAPAELGDVMLEIVNPATTSGINKQYTVVARIGGSLWVVAGQDIIDGKPNETVQYVTTYAVTPVGANSSIFTRVFQTIWPGSNDLPRRPVEDAAIIQRGLERLKVTVEAATPPG